MKAKSQVDLTPTLQKSVERNKLAASIMKNAYHIGDKTIAWIPVELLSIKPYQRNRQRHITQIAENWDDSKCNVLLVAYDELNGCFYVMDGQHRAIAARMRGVEYLVCEIFTGMTTSQEASLFVGQNENTKKLTPFDTYKANQFIVGEDETELSKIDKKIASVCKKYGVKVEKSNAKNTLKSVAVARAIVRRNGVGGLVFVMEVITNSCWNEFPDGYAGDLMASLGKLYGNPSINKNIAMDRLCEFFKTSNPSELAALANNTYPSLGRRGRLDAILAEIIKDPSPVDPEKKDNKNLTKIA